MKLSAKGFFTPLKINPVAITLCHYVISPSLSSNSHRKRSLVPHHRFPNSLLESAVRLKMCQKQKVYTVEIAPLTVPMCQYNSHALNLRHNLLVILFFPACDLWQLLVDELSPRGK